MTESQSTHNSIAMYERFCDDVSLPNKRYTENLQIMLLLFQKNIDTREAYKAVFSSDPFLDWSQIENLGMCKLYRDTSAWIAVMRFCQFKASFSGELDYLNWKLFAQLHKIFSHFQTSMVSASLHMQPMHVMHLFLLLNTSNLQALNVMEMFFSMTFNR